MQPHSRLTGLFCAVFLMLLACGALWAEPSDPVRAVENADAEQAAASARVVDGFKMELWAAEPLLENPVALDIDEHGRVYVVETHRLHRGVSDNRDSAFWVDDDLAADTVEDRLAYQKKFAEDGTREWDWYIDYGERVRLIVDEDEDGKADVSHTFADGFNDPLHGLASGVLAYRGNVYLANIPDLVLLQDTDGDHHADEQEMLHHGYGVRTAFLGHDLHGLTLGPDGKLYFSIGDRGYNIEMEDGSRLRDPLNVGRGAVFRCNLDGSELEVVYYGLRNPQDLAFDEYGNLFTGDNNSDAGDEARIVYLIEGGDAGWSMTFQYMNEPYLRGPWHAERIWHLENDEQPAWTLPPLAHLSAGPSGFEYNPGTAFGEQYDGYFFMCDFRGNAANSGIYAFTVEQEGASFKVLDPHEFIWSVLATDIKFGYDGKLYVTDWESGWGIQDPPKGRVHAAYNVEQVDDPAVDALSELMRRDFMQMQDGELVELLGHADMRVRMRAQFALAAGVQERSDAAALRSAAREGAGELVRLHAVWGMGQLLREGHTFVLDGLLARLGDESYHVRAQAAKVIGEGVASAGGGEAVRKALRSRDGVTKLIERLEDDSPHVRALTAIALGKVGDERAFEPLLRLIHDNDDADRWIRHAGAMGLHGVADGDLLVERAATASAPQRLAIVLALRRAQDPRLANFLNDAEAHIVREAATAIYDLDITEAMPALAAMLDRYTRQASQAEQASGFQRRFYEEIPGGSIDELRGAEKFPDSPDAADTSRTLAVAPERGEQYGTLITGHLVPPQDGDYTFFVAADDSAEVHLSTSTSADDKRLIASVPSWTDADQFDKHAEQTSEPITLEAGRRYYIEVLHKEGDGGDHLTVGWRLPDGTEETPIGGGMGDAPVALLRRVVNANLALGKQEHAERVAAFAADATQPDVLRREALAVLGEWAEAPIRDRVLNYSRPLPERDVEIVREALEPVIVTIVDSSVGQVQSQATDLATELELALDEESLMARLSDPTQSIEARLAGLRSLIGSNSPRAREAIGKAMEAEHPLLRAEGRRLLAQRDAAAGLGALTEALEEGTVVEQQLALASLGALRHDGADEVLADWLEELTDGSVAPELQLDLVEAARQRRSSAVAERLAEYEESLSAEDPLAAHRIATRGGDAETGRNIFFSHAMAQCIRCHTIDGTGGDAGPDLTGIGSRRDRSQLLSDLVLPNDTVAEGYGTVVVTLEGGRVIAGTLREETEQTLTLVTGDGQVHEVAADEVASRTPAVSAMPPMGSVLSPRELRDVIEFLATHEEE